MLRVLERTFNTLDDVQDWAYETSPRKIVIYGDGTIKDGGTAWSYTAPLGVAIRGGHFDGDGAKGWWLNFGPKPNSGQLKLYDVYVTGYQSGGVSAAANLDGLTEPSGEKVWLRKVTILRSRFHEINGISAVYLQGVKQFDISYTKFAAIGRAKTDHAIYATDRSGPGIVRRSTFKDVYGDPIRARDGSQINVFGCTSTDSGMNGLASTWDRVGEDKSTISVYSSTANRTYKDRRAKLITNIKVPK